MERKACFPPVADGETRVLILGSLPGEESLRRGQYYGHPQNRFWELVASAIGTPLRPLSYPDRLQMLLRHRVGLWDVIAHAERTGSLDSAIRDAAPNDLSALVASLPKLQAVAFNGRKAGHEGRKLLAGAAPEVTLIDLPSSSPAYAAMPLEEKKRRWAAIADHL